MVALSSPLRSVIGAFAAVALSSACASVVETGGTSTGAGGDTPISTGAGATGATGASASGGSVESTGGGNPDCRRCANVFFDGSFAYIPFCSSQAEADYDALIACTCQANTCLEICTTGMYGVCNGSFNGDYECKDCIAEHCPSENELCRATLP